MRMGANRDSRIRVLDTQQSYVGGLNVSAAPFQMRNDQIRRAENTRLDPFGGATKRGGTQYLSVAPLPDSPVAGGFGWSTSAVEQMVIANGRLYTGTLTLPSTAWNPEGSPGDFSLRAPSFAAFRDATAECVYIADGGLLNKWDGTTVTTNIAGTPAVTRVWVYNRRLWGIGNPAYGQTVYWSALDDGDSLGDQVAGGGEAVVRTFGQSDIITGGSLKSSSMLIHKGGVSRFTGWSQDDISIDAGTRGVSGDVGTIYERSFIAIENVAFFLTDRGFYQLTEGEVRSNSRRIDPIVSVFNPLYKDSVCVGHNRQFREIWWYLPEIGCIVYNYEIDAWSGPMTGVFLDPGVTCFWDTVDVNNQPVFLAGMADGNVIRVDAPNVFRDLVDTMEQGGTQVQMVMQCRPFFAGSTLSTKVWRWAYVNASLRGSNRAQLEMQSGTGYAVRPVTGQNLGPLWDPTQFWDPAQVWGGLSNEVYRVPLGYQGQYVLITLTDDGFTRPPTFNQIDILGFDLGAR